MLKGSVLAPDGGVFGTIWDHNVDADEVTVLAGGKQSVVVSAHSLIPTDDPEVFQLAYEIEFDLPPIDTDGIRGVLNQRGSRYGDFADNSEATQIIKAVLRASPSWERMRPYQQEALEMIAHKVSRIINGDPDYDDSWKDIIGYAQLVLDKLGEHDA